MSHLNREDIKTKIEALLFSSGRYVTVQELSKLLRTGDTESVASAARELMNEYNSKNTSLMIVEESDAWKITTREKFLPLVRKVVAKTELSKTLMETLAVIAYKAPVLQSEVISIRTNKAYDHIKELEKLGFIVTHRHGRSRMIKLSQKFFDYFDIDEAKLKKRLSKYKDVESEIKAKELENQEKAKKYELAHHEEKGEELSEEKNQENRKSAAKVADPSIEAPLVKPEPKENFEPKSNGLYSERTK